MKYPILLFSPLRILPVAKSHSPLPKPSNVKKLPLLNGEVKTVDAAWHKWCDRYHTSACGNRSLNKLLASYSLPSYQIN